MTTENHQQHSFDLCDPEASQPALHCEHSGQACDPNAVQVVHEETDALAIIRQRWDESNYRYTVHCSYDTLEW